MVWRFKLIFGALILVGLVVAALVVVADPPEREASEQAALRIVDGDGLELEGVKIRLWGIDAPELGQTCASAAGPAYPCGEAAAVLLTALVAEGTLACTVVDTDRFKRPVMRCAVAGVDIGREMVKRGWAVDYGRYSGGFYAGDQEAAKAARRGMWAGSFVMPWDWRRQMNRDGR